MTHQAAIALARLVCSMQTTLLAARVGLHFDPEQICLSEWVPDGQQYYEAACMRCLVALADGACQVQLQADRCAVSAMPACSPKKHWSTLCTPVPHAALVL
jgi:hypothetical protein